MVLDLSRLECLENSSLLWACLDCHSHNHIHLHPGRHGGFPLAQAAPLAGQQWPKGKFGPPELSYERHTVSCCYVSTPI